MVCWAICYYHMVMMRRSGFHTRFHLPNCIEHKKLCVNYIGSRAAPPSALDKVYPPVAEICQQRPQAPKHCRVGSLGCWCCIPGTLTNGIVIIGCEGTCCSRTGIGEGSLQQHFPVQRLGQRQLDGKFTVGNGPTGIV